MLFWPVQAPPPMSSPTAQVATNDPYPPQMLALLTAKDWAGLADWFETQPPALRGRHYETWVQALNRSQRWGRLVEICEALQPQLEARTGPRLGTYRLYRARALSGLSRHAEAAVAHAENGRLGDVDGFPMPAPKPGWAWTGRPCWFMPMSCSSSGQKMASAWPGGARPSPA